MDNKATFSINILNILLSHQYIPIDNCWLLTKSFSCLWVANALANWSNKPAWPSEEVLDRLCHFLSVDLSNTTWALRGLINGLLGNKRGINRTKSKSKYRDKYYTTFGTMTAIVLHLVPKNVELDPQNPQLSQTQDSTLKTHGTARRRIRPKNLRHSQMEDFT